MLFAEDSFLFGYEFRVRIKNIVKLYTSRKNLSLKSMVFTHFYLSNYITSCQKGKRILIFCNKKSHFCYFLFPVSLFLLFLFQNCVFVCTNVINIYPQLFDIHLFSFQFSLCSSISPIFLCDKPSNEPSEHYEKNLIAIGFLKAFITYEPVLSAVSHCRQTYFSKNSLAKLLGFSGIF